MEEKETNPDAEQIASDVRAWRGSLAQGKAASLLGLSKRTFEGIEQGRGFRYPQLLRIAMKATKAK